MEYKTKDSGKRKKFSTGMQRDVNDGKIRPDLCIPSFNKNNMLLRWAALMQRGVKKYGERNWEKSKTPEELNRFKESAFRHFIQWYLDEDDEDHAAAVFFNIQGAEHVRERIQNE